MLERVEAPALIISKRRRHPTAGVRGWLDYETRSCVDLRVVGPYEYAIHPTTEIICMAWAVGKDPVRLCLPGDPWPEELFKVRTFGAHNANFECLITRYVAHPRHGFPIIPIERFNCSMARCLAVGLPASLSKVADAKALANRKDAAGQRLMLLMNKPRRARRDEDPNGGPYWHENPEQLQRLYAYCKQDVEVERELDGVIPELSKFERQVWLVDHKINFENGFGIDRKLATNAYKIAQQAGPEIDAEIAELTGGEVTSINQRDRLLKWAQAQGYTGKSLTRDAIERFLAQGDPS